MRDELTKVDIDKINEEINYRKYELAPKLREEMSEARGTFLNILFYLFTFS